MTSSKQRGQSVSQRLGEGKILPLIIRLSVPAVIAQLITFLYNIVDRMYVARIEQSGMDALAALGIVLPITLIMQAFANLVGLGGAPRAGIKWARKFRFCERVFNTSFFAASSHRHRSRRSYIRLCAAHCRAVRLPAKRGGFCRFLSQDIFLRFAFHNAVPRAQSLYTDPKAIR